MEQSVTVKELFTAMAMAQAEMPVVQKDSTNPFLKNKFASLGAIIEAVRPVLGKYGLSVMQFPTGTAPAIGLTTIISHSSGEWIRDTIYLLSEDEKGKSLAQVAGSIITYLRRYSISGVLGVVTEDDTDGNLPQSPKITPVKARAWSVAIKDAIVEAEYAANAFDAKGMLDLSNLAEDIPVKNALFWAKAYRCARDEDLLPVQAAEKANDEYAAEVIRRRQDKSTA